MWKTKRDFERSLGASYKQFRLPRQKLGQGAALWEIRKTHEVKGVHAAERGLAVLDVLVSDAIAWCFLLSGLLFKHRELFSDKDLHRSLWALINALVQDSIVIRDLINQGFDLQARNLLRSFDERLDLIYYICVNPGAAAEFAASTDEKTSNDFWRRHLSGQRARKIVNAKVKEILGADFEEEFSTFRDEERKMLSAAHHPSYWAITNSMFPPSTQETFLFANFGVRSEFSFRTSKFLFNSLCEFVLVFIHLRPEVIEILKDDRSLGEVDDEKPFLVRYALHLGNMGLELIRNWRAPIFGESPQMKKFLKTLPPERAE
jgi:hypothetical protein